MLDNLPSEQANSASTDIDAVSTRRLMETINAEDRLVALAVGEEIPRIAEALDRIDERFRRGGRLIYLGAGTSGRLGVLDASELPPTYGLDPDRAVGLIAGGDGALRRSVEGAEDDFGGAVAALTELAVGTRDSVIGLAASGRTPWVAGGLEFARSRGALTIGISTNPEAEIFRHCDATIAPAVGPEVITGSTRMKGGTAQKLVLNMLSTGLMVRMGCVLGNRMVNVQLTNAKLRERARRMVAEIAEVDLKQALEVLETAGDVRPAVLMARFGLEVAEARKLLERHDGVLRRAIEEAEQAG